MSHARVLMDSEEQIHPYILYLEGWISPEQFEEAKDNLNQLWLF